MIYGEKAISPFVALEDEEDVSGEIPEEINEATNFEEDGVGGDDVEAEDDFSLDEGDEEEDSSELEE